MRAIRVWVHRRSVHRLEVHMRARERNREEKGGRERENERCIFLCSDDASVDFSRDVIIMNNTIASLIIIHVSSRGFEYARIL